MYGIAGLKLYVKIRFPQKKVVSFSFPEEFTHPIFLRTGTTDFSTFMDVIFGKAYEFSFKSMPDVIIDCGANIGLTSVFWKNKYPASKIISIEPEKNNFEILSKNMGNYDNTVLYNNGIWNKAARLKIVDPGLGEWGFMVQETEEEIDAIRAVSIKDIMLQNDIETIDILKIDIEGSEKELFESDYDYWLPRTKVIIIELHDRLRKGASQSFFSALVKYKFETVVKGQNIFCFLNN